MITLTLLSHLSLFHFKPLHLFKAISTTQTAESTIKPQINQYDEVFRRQA